MNNFIAGPAKVDAFLNGQLMFTAKTILDSSINLSTNKEEVRGGNVRIVNRGEGNFSAHSVRIIIRI